MKLKYYLRGLGVGIVITAFISIIASTIKGDNMTTDQIILKAKTFGMVSQEDYNTVKNDLSEAQNNIKDLQVQLEGADETTKQPQEQETQKGEANEEEPVEDNSNTGQVTTNETYIEGSVSESTTMKFNITPGMGSGAVANILAEKGIIPDADDFNQYVIDSGDSNNLQVGEYEVKAGESYDTIIAKLTGR